MNKILIGCLTYNRWDFTKRCLESLYANTDINDFNLIIFDNSSTDNTKENLKELKYPNLSIYYGYKNFGVAGGLNRILRYRLPEQHFMKLDNDMIFKEGTDKNWIKKINEIFDSNILINTQDSPVKIGTICIKPYTWDEKEKKEINLIPEYQELKIGQLNFQFNPEGVLGCSTIYRKEVFDFLPKFDEDFVYGYEESLTHCIMLKHKYISLFNKDICRVYHIDPGGDTDYIKWKHKIAKEGYQKYLNKYNKLSK